MPEALIFLFQVFDKYSRSAMERLMLGVVFLNDCIRINALLDALLH